MKINDVQHAFETGGAGGTGPGIVEAMVRRVPAACEYGARAWT